MRTLIFSTDEICESQDLITLQADRLTDLSSVLATANINAVAYPVFPSIDAVGILSGFQILNYSVVGTDLQVSISAGAVVYRYPEADGSLTTKVAQVEAFTAVIPLASSGFKRAFLLELIVREEVEEAERRFRTDINGRAVISIRDTPKYRKSVVSVTLRFGTDFGVSNPTVILPTFVGGNTLPNDGVIPIVYGEVGSSTGSAFDCCKRYMPTYGTFFSAPIQASVTRSSLSFYDHYTDIERVVVSFDTRNMFDGCILSASGVQIAYEAGFTLVGTSHERGYVYLVRPSDRSSLSYLVISNKPPTGNRRPSTPITAGTTMGGSITVTPGTVFELKDSRYLFTIRTGISTVTTMVVNGNESNYVSDQPAYTVSGLGVPVDGSAFDVDFSSLIGPVPATYAESRVLASSLGGSNLIHTVNLSTTPIPAQSSGNRATEISDANPTTVDAATVVGRDNIRLAFTRGNKLVRVRLDLNSADATGSITFFLTKTVEIFP